MTTITQSKTWTCAENTDAVRLDILDATGTSERNYLVDRDTQAFAAIQGNIANLRYADAPPRWFVGDVEVAGAGRPIDMHYKYHLTFWGDEWQARGDAWIGVLPGYDDVYFYFVMPVESEDHPNCGYGSISRETVDVLLKPRR